jgi:AcrR family transcriptional regulator
MGIKERREREKQDLRQKILDAAQEIITREGFAALSMRKLAERIEYSAAAIYLHFRSREQIAQELSEAGFNQILTKMQAAAEEGDAVARVSALGLAYVSFGLEHPETYRLMFMGDSEYMAAAFADKSADNPANCCYQLLIDAANSLKRDGLYPGEATAAEIAEMIWVAAHGIVSLTITCPGFQLSSPMGLATIMTDTLVNGLLAKSR